MSFTQLKDSSLSEIAALESKLPSKIMDIDAKLASMAGSSLQDMEQKFAETTGSGINETVATLLSYARAEAATCVLNLSKYDRFISLCVPKVEDGNNFGVAIQMETRKIVQDRRQKIKELFDKCADYHKDRAVLWKEITPKSSIEKVETKSQTQDQESKNNDETNTDKQSTATKTETKSTTPQGILPDAVAAVVAFDVSWYFHLYYTLEHVRDSYIAIGDVVDKNRTRLEHPKGDGQSVMNMF